MGRCHYSHFTDEGTKIVGTAFLRSHSYLVEELGFEPTAMGSRSLCPLPFSNSASGERANRPRAPCNETPIFLWAYPGLQAHGRCLTGSRAIEGAAESKHPPGEVPAHTLRWALPFSRPALLALHWTVPGQAVGIPRRTNCAPGPKKPHSNGDNGQVNQ